MIENEDKSPHNKFEKIMNIENFHILDNIYLILIINFKKLLEALLLKYIGFTQYEIHFRKSNK